MRTALVPTKRSMMCRHYFRPVRMSVVLLTLIFLLLVLLPFVVRAQQSVAYGVFFYSPTCPHCREVIDNHWPGIQAEFGDQLQVLFVNVTTPEGSATMQTALRALHVSSNGVPMLIIGSTVLVGSIDIPERAPTIIRAGLSAGGIALPAIPGIEALFQASGQLKTPVDHAGVNTRLTDPANAIAVGIAVGLGLSLAIVLLAGWLSLTGRSRRLLKAMSGNLGWGAQFLAAVIGIGLAASLIFGSSSGIITLLSGSVALIFLLLAIMLLRTPATAPVPRWLVPLVALAGIIVAAYLAYVEITLTKAVCGSLGGCDTVQESAYARVLGIPVGMIGIFGYVAMLLTWWMGQFKQQSWADEALFVFALLGLGFSLYLTILEPFVIGASCVWCLTSAVVMAALAWMTAPAGWKALGSS